MRLRAITRPMYDDLDAVRLDAAQRLAKGASSRHSAFHMPVIGTGDGDMRTMVLRGFDAESWTLRLHTDARSPKVDVIAADSRVAFLAYDPKAHIQLRLRGAGRIETDTPAADAAWAEATNFGKRCYLAEDAPGAIVTAPTSGLPEWAEGIQPTDDQVAPARENFAILLIEVEEIDWLYLANDGHRRAILGVGEGGEARWVVP